MDSQVALAKSLNSHPLVLDLPRLFRSFSDPFSVEAFKTLIIGLNEKLKTLTLLQTKADTSESVAQSHLKSREDLSASISLTCDTLSQHQNDLNSELQKKIKERDTIQNKHLELERAFRQKCISINELEGTINVLNGQVAELKSEIKDFKAMEKMIEHLRQEIKTSDKERELFRKKYKQTVQELENELRNRESELEKRDTENYKLVEEMIEKQEKIQNLSSENESKLTRIKLLESEIEDLKAQTKCLADMEKKARNFELLAKKHQEECVRLQTQHTATTKSHIEQVSVFNEEKNALHRKIDTFSLELQKVQHELQEKTAQYRAELVTSQDLRTKHAIIQQKLASAMDAGKIYTQVKYLSTFASEIKDKLVEDNDELSEKVCKTASDYLNACRLIVQIREIIEDRDCEISILRELVAELQNKTTYYPVKDDPVDEAIADYINTRSEPMPINFIREEYGVYLFGTKKVFIKLENNKLTSNFYSVRVGGGYMRIDQFVNTYMPIELEKINERKFERNKPGRKALMSRVLDTIGKEYLVTEKAQKKEMSPEKTVKILQDAFSGQTNFSKCIVAPKKSSGSRLTQRPKNN
jgi:myosin heavy subunit